MDNNALSKIKNSAVSIEVMEILREGHFIDNLQKELYGEKCLGNLTDEEKAVYALYKNSFRQLAKARLEAKNFNDLKKRIKATSALFVELVRTRLGYWDNRLIDVRQGHRVVVVNKKTDPRLMSCISSRRSMDSEKNMSCATI